MVAVKKTFEFTLNISADEFLKLYRGLASDVIVRTDSGVRVSFPAVSLKPFVTHMGISGRFAICVDEDNKLLSLDRLS